VVGGIPPGTPPDQVYIVPPQWAVCALTSNVARAPGVLYVRDKQSSAAYFATKSLAEAMAARLTPSAVKTQQALDTCARGSVALVQREPDVATLALYSELVGTGSACHSAFQGVFEGDEVAARKSGSRALELLKRGPALLKNSQFLRAFLS